MCLKKNKFYILFFVFLFSSNFIFAEVKLPMIFSDHMVLQGNMEVPIWGWADPGENITVQLGVHISTTKTGDNGKWKLFIGPLDLGGPFQLEITGKNHVVVNDVLVGEVWVCSGQSNMAMEVQNSLNAKEEIARANYPLIRHFQVKRSKAALPMQEILSTSNDSGSWLNTWEICSPSNVGHFSGVGYFFIRDLYLKLKVPVGVISASWGGTTAEAWTPRDTLEKNSELSKILSNWPDYNNDEEWLKDEYSKYLKKVKEASKIGREKILYFNQPSVLFNGMIAPVIPYGIKGVVWYQGESNTYRAYQYRHLFPAMIEAWRKKWEQGNFPFLFVQLANYHFEPQNFPELREAQAMALSLPNTAMAVAIDIGNSSDIHPKNKQDVGKRLSLAARKIAYGEDITYSGPIFQYMMIDGGKCILNFKHMGDGLTTKGDDELKGFTIAGKDKKFVKARCKIQGAQIIVWSDEVTAPVAVRYAWQNNPESNLYNSFLGKTYLPASPFRTDDWKGITSERY